jgi:hypothetical protein
MTSTETVDTVRYDKKLRSVSLEDLRQAFRAWQFDLKELGPNERAKPGTPAWPDAAAKYVFYILQKNK